MQRSSKHTALAFLLGALLAGGALGFTAARVFDREARAAKSYESVREQLARQLELSPEQKARYDAILERRDATYDSIMAPVDSQVERLRPAVKRVRDGARAELRTILSAPQQREYDRYLAMMEERESRRLARRDSLAKARGGRADTTSQ